MASIWPGLQLQPALKEKDWMHLIAIADNFINKFLEGERSSNE